MMVRDPYFNFSSTLPANTNVLEVHNLLQQVSRSCPPNSTFTDSAVFSSKLCPTFVCVESNEEASAAEGGCGSASPSEKAQPSQHGEEPPRQQSSGGRSRVGGGRRNETRHTLYKGVRKRQGGRWVSEIREPGKKSRIWLGTFPTPEMAARAYDVAVFNLKRPYAYVNFPEAVSSLPILQSRSAKNIQKAASAAATAFRGAASSGHAGRSGGVVPTSEAAETSNLAFTSSPMPEQQPWHPQSTSPPTTRPSLFDEDLIFNMPNVMIEMAEGLMIMPPLLHHGTDYGDNNINKSKDDNDRAGSPLWDL